MKNTRRIVSLILSLALIFSTFAILRINAVTTGTESSEKRLRNGNFEENAKNYSFSSNYTQPYKNAVPYWDTTAFGKNGKPGQFEFFKSTSAHFDVSRKDNNLNNDENYKNGNYFKVAEGEVAAELNADEVSTIYQRVETISGSTYTWGLDHRGRDLTDSMVLIIGPQQEVDPSKTSYNGEDQFVKITSWLKKQYSVEYPPIGCSKKYTVYSRKFAANGKFEGNLSDDDRNISLVETDLINQEWSIWIISSPYCNRSTDKTVAVNGWSKYGTNVINSTNKNDKEKFEDVMKGESSSLGYDCTYTVPKGQTSTLFAFCSFSSGSKTNPNQLTYGNLLDDINFDLYQPISTSITEGGIGGADAEQPDLSNVTIKSDIISGDALNSVVLDGKYCTIYTKEYNGGTLKDCSFEGAYITVNEADGTPVTRFLKIYDGDIRGLTEEEKKTLSEQYFIFEPKEIVNTETGVVEKWDYYCRVLVDSPVAVHLIYTKAPYVLYDSNGGAPYMFTSDNKYGGNLVGFSDSFKTATDDNGNVIDTTEYYNNSEYSTAASGDEVIKEGKYISHAALPNKDWAPNSAEFCGWSVNKIDGDNVEKIIINGVHTITYNPTTGNGGIVSITDSKNNITDLQLDASHGITLTAVWKFKSIAQAQTRESDSGDFVNSALGGTIEETLIAEASRNENIKETKQNVNGEDRVERIEASGSVGDKVMFKAKPDYTNDYMFSGWYCFNSKTGEYELRSKSTSIAVTIEEGKLDTYYARFEKITFPVVFYYTKTGDPANYEYYDKTDEKKYGNYYQDVAAGKKAVKPSGDSQSVTVWYTSPTERSQEYIFDFENKKIMETTKLYAGPVFDFNYINFFRFKEPWSNYTYGTLGINGTYLDLKTDKNVTDYNVYMLKGTVGEATPTPSAVIGNRKTIKIGKSVDSANLVFNSATNTNQTFNRAGALYDDYYLFDMKTPVWVVFDFTYKGVKYISTVKDRSLYNNITTYMAEEKNGYFTTFPPDTQTALRGAQIDLLKSIQAMYDSVAPSGITAPSKYYDSVSVSGLTYDSTTDGKYSFSSTTAIRNIEPWGLKYSFTVDGKAVTEFADYGIADYGAVVLTDKDGSFGKGTVSIENLLSNENSVMYSNSSGNVYSAKDNSTVDIYYVNNMSALDFEKNNYAVFFVKDSNGNFCFSNIVVNSYNSVADSDTSKDAGISRSIKNYSTALITYNDLVEQAKQNNQ